MARLPSAPEHQVRRRIKQLRQGLHAIIASIGKDGTYEGLAKVRGFDDPVRVIVRAKSSLPESWAMSIIFGERIDGIDWEKEVEDHRGPKHNCSGWHRHMWKPASRDKHKQCLPAFKPTSLEDFVVEGFRVLNVKLGRSVEDGNQYLLFNQGRPG